eukprot:3976347-Pyramimonas_sp.AAC.1
MCIRDSLRPVGRQHGLGSGGAAGFFPHYPSASHSEPPAPNGIQEVREGSLLGAHPEARPASPRSLIGGPLVDTGAVTSLGIDHLGGRNRQRPGAPQKTVPGSSGPRPGGTE